MPFPPIMEELSPETIGEDLIVLSLDVQSLDPRAFRPITVNVDYSACEPDGIVLPLELLIVAPSPSGFSHRHFTRTAPTSILFIPREGGLHGLLLREVGHNRWNGRLRIQVAGDPLDPQRPS